MLAVLAGVTSSAAGAGTKLWLLSEATNEPLRRGEEWTIALGGFPCESAETGKVHTNGRTTDKVIITSGYHVCYGSGNPWRAITGHMLTMRFSVLGMTASANLMVETWEGGVRGGPVCHYKIREVVGRFALNEPINSYGPSMATLEGSTVLDRFLSPSGCSQSAGSWSSEWFEPVIPSTVP